MESIQTASIASAGMAMSVRFSIFSGKKKDSSVSGEVAQSKGAEASSGDYYANLFGDSARLNAIIKYKSVITKYTKSHSQPWGDDAVRLLPTARFFDVRKGLGSHEAKFDLLVTDFIDHLDDEISKQAFKRGSMFNINDYPTAKEARERFGMRVCFSPIPLSGDWRVDIGEEGKAELATHYEETMKLQIDAIIQDAWDKLKSSIERMTRQLAPLSEEELNAEAEDGKRKQKVRKIYDSLLEIPLEQCALLSELNINHNPKLEEVRVALENALVNITTEDLRKSEGTKAKVLSDVEAILAKMNGG